MLPANRTTTHPGEILRLDYLEPLGISQVTLAAHLGIPVQRVNEIVKGKRGITPQTAWLLAGAFSTSPELWLNLQRDYDLSSSRPRTSVKPIARTHAPKKNRAA